MKRHHGKSQEQAGRFPLLTQAGTGRIFTNEMEEASTQNWSELVSKYAETGYLLLRQFLKRDKVKRARKYIVQELEKEGYLKPNSEVPDFTYFFQLFFLNSTRNRTKQVDFETNLS
eukprot:TRINITY_DN9989_c0_g1_i2.p1 TRINITY_DN9989_c0_g1~~TRINITY_DN9989_c0_g1_i2.p1  ORF type:complete len:116 (-),score=24.55 TRINITY_DN9989_c0_g1_i2:955-1302(-)